MGNRLPRSSTRWSLRLVAAREETTPLESAVLGSWPFAIGLVGFTLPIMSSVLWGKCVTLPAICPQCRASTGLGSLYLSACFYNFAIRLLLRLVDPKLRRNFVVGIPLHLTNENLLANIFRMAQRNLGYNQHLVCFACVYNQNVAFYRYFSEYLRW